jgi:hypothetical protein
VITNSTRCRGHARGEQSEVGTAAVGRWVGLPSRGGLAWPACLVGRKPADFCRRACCLLGRPPTSSRPFCPCRPALASPQWGRRRRRGGRSSWEPRGRSTGAEDDRSSIDRWPRRRGIRRGPRPGGAKHGLCKWTGLVG